MTFEWNDLPSATQSSIAAVKMTMTRNRDGTPYQTKENCLIALEHDPVLAGAFCHNDLTDRIDVVKDTGWHRETPALTDTDLSHIYLYLEKYYGLTNDKNIQHALDVVTAKHHYHPIRQLLESLQWDGQERVRYALHHFLGAATDDLTSFTGLFCKIFRKQREIIAFSACIISISSYSSCKPVNRKKRDRKETGRYQKS